MSRASRILSLISCCGMAKKMKSNNMEEFPVNLAGFGYGFNDAGQLRQRGEDGKLTSQGFQFEVRHGDRGFNQRHYEALGEVITEEVYTLLETKGGLQRLEVDKSFVFASKGFEDKERVVVLIHGSGVVRAGQWTRKLIINEDLNKGTMLPFIAQFLSSDWGVLVLNTNHNNDPRSGKVLPGHGDPEEHARSVWGKMVGPSKASKVVVIAHSYGGVVVMDLAKAFPEDFLHRVGRVLMTDSVHYKMSGVREVDERLIEVGTNYVASDLEVGAKEEGRFAKESKGIERLSAGDGRHEWTSWSAMEEIFKEVEKVASDDGTVTATSDKSIEKGSFKDNPEVSSVNEEVEVEKKEL